VAPEGYKIVGADYSQQELRVVASLSREQAMLDAYKQDKDLHTRTAALIFSRDEIELHNLIQSCKRKQSEGLDTEITKEELEAVSQRSIAKSVNFLIIYGGGHTTLAFNADLSENYAREIIDSYKKNFPGVVAFAEDEGRKALSLGYTKTLSGRKRYYPPLPPPNDPDYNRLKAAVLRKASNVPVQGGSADIGKKAMIYVTNEFNRRFGESNAYIAIAVHDELQCVVKDVYAEEAKEILRRGMEEAFYFYIPESLCPIKVDTSIGEHWIH
jgi:DNA polymerase-1